MYSDPSIEPSVFVIVILVIILIILYIFHIIKQKRQNVTTECNCNVGASSPNKPEIKNLSKSQNDNKKTQTNVVALYYSNSCGYSRDFLPEWQKLKEKIKAGDLGTNIDTAEYECSQDKDACEKNKINGVPSIILHKATGESINYPDSKPRNIEAISEFIKRS